MFKNKCFYILICLCMSLTGYAKEPITFVDERFNQVLKEYSYRSGDAKVTPDTVINPYGNEYVNVIKGNCELLKNEIGYIKLHCRTWQDCMKTPSCDSPVEPFQNYLSFEILDETIKWKGKTYRLVEMRYSGQDKLEDSFSGKTLMIEEKPHLQE